MPRTETKKLTLASDFEEVEKVEAFVDELQEWAEFDDELYGNILLTLSEAVTNAIVHGNKEDRSKNVFITAILKESQITISVKDEGNGFDPSELPDPLKEKNLLKEGGRGVYLIEQFADKMEYSEKGTKLIMRFDLD